MIGANFTLIDILALIGVPSISAFLFQLVYNSLSHKVKKSKENGFIMKKALQSLLRDKLREHYIQFVERGWASIADKDNFENLYSSYHQLGVNGVMNEMRRVVLALPDNPNG